MRYTCLLLFCGLAATDNSLPEKLAFRRLDNAAKGLFVERVCSWQIPI